MQWVFSSTIVTMNYPPNTQATPTFPQKLFPVSLCFSTCLKECRKVAFTLFQGKIYITVPLQCVCTFFPTSKTPTIKDILYWKGSVAFYWMENLEKSPYWPAKKASVFRHASMGQLSTLGINNKLEQFLVLKILFLRSRSSPVNWRLLISSGYWTTI